MRGAASRRDLAVDRVGEKVSGRVVFFVAAVAVVREEFIALAVDQTAAELHAGRLPGGRVEPDHARRKVAIRIELQELDIDESRAARNAIPTPSPVLLLGAVVRRNIFIMPPEHRITAFAGWQPRSELAISKPTAPTTSPSRHDESVRQNC